MSLVEHGNDEHFTDEREELRVRIQNINVCHKSGGRGRHNIPLAQELVTTFETSFQTHIKLFAFLLLKSCEVLDFA